MHDSTKDLPVPTDDQWRVFFFYIFFYIIYTSVGDKRHLRVEESGQFFAFDQFNYPWYKLWEVWQNSIFFQLD